MAKLFNVQRFQILRSQLGSPMTVSSWVNDGRKDIPNSRRQVLIARDVHLPINLGEGVF